MQSEKNKKERNGIRGLAEQFQKAYIWVIGVPGKQRGEEKENIRRNNSLQLSKSDKRHKHIDSKSSRIPKMGSPKRGKPR